MIIMLKKGLSHIEVILAFVLFISAVTAMFLIFNPQPQKNSNNQQLNQIMQKFERDATTNFVEFGVKINSINSNNVSILISNYSISGENASSEDYAGNTLQAYAQQQGSSYIVCIQGNPLPNFLYLLLSPDVNQNSESGTCSVAGNESNYQIAGANSGTILSEKKILELNSSYYSNYNELKKTIGIPDNEEFSFEVVFDNKNSIEGSNNIPQNVQVSALSNNIEVLRQNGDRQFAKIGVKIW